METWDLFRWIVAAIAAGVVAHHAKRAGRAKWGVWGLATFFLPWLVVPIYVLMAAAGAAGADGLSKGGSAGPRQQLSEADLMQLADDMASADGAERARLIRELGGAWADAMADSAHPKNVALIRINVGKAADAAKLDDLQRAAEFLMKAMSQVPPDRKGHPGGRLLLGGVNRAVELVAAAKRKSGGAPAPRPASPPELAERLVMAPEPKVVKAERAVARPADDVPAFLAPRAAPEVESPRPEAPDAGGPVAETPPAAVAVAPPPPPPPPPPASLPPVAAARFAGAGLAEVSADVAELARQWLAAIAETAAPGDRSTARVRLESAASAVFRGDWARAIEMAEAAAALVPAEAEAAVVLRAGLAHAKAARAA